MKFKKMSKAFEILTTKGTLVIENTEYYQIDGERANAPIVINKEGIQKIEDFFGVESGAPVIQQVWNSGNNFSIIATTSVVFDGSTYYGVGSGSNLNLTNAISQAYPAEMAVKRAKAVAALEVLRKNYIGSDRLPLLYSSFDEFNTEEAVNTTVGIVEDKKSAASQTNAPASTKVEKVVETTKKADPVPQSAPEVPKNEPEVEVEVTVENEGEVEVEVTPNESNEDVNEVQTQETETQVEKEEPAAEEGSEDVGSFVLYTTKFRNGITIKELSEKDAGYLSWLATAENVNGKYVEYQQKVRTFMNENNIQTA